jgi:hypothetical protein
MKIVALSAVLSITQQATEQMQAQQRDGVIPQDIVARERDFICGKLAGLFALASEIASDLEAQEDDMRARAQQLRQAADTSLI